MTLRVGVVELEFGHIGYIIKSFIYFEQILYSIRGRRANYLGNVKQRI